ncbi:uncharacterized protein N7473_012646 [Penicillium subrubescens]|uniref:uncharacterized protein n=1 Tax=Penicillium subrubescens TaxID=1316194 RepID=UPI002544DB27|nr:uncharacterized protein N7473_012646 [Penicillium subrubescens]KAJ5875299.1 hypothetical protein N7473_012646 [Penicillium subrubescens]
MLLKNVLATFAIAGLTAASPVDGIEARAVSGTCAKNANAWCCATAFPFSIFFIQKVGSNCVRPSGSGPSYSCSNKPGRPNFLCCDNNELTDDKGGVVCVV